MLRAWGKLGYPRRALRLHEAAAAIAERHGDVVPSDVDELRGAARGRRVHRTGGRRVRLRPAVPGGRHQRPPGGRPRGARRAATPDRPGPRADLADVDALLPAADGPAATVSAALMELGAVVCTARAPALRRTARYGPSARGRRAGRPGLRRARGKPVQGFAGTDRQVRGRLLDVLRDAPGAGRAGRAGRGLVRRRAARPLPATRCSSTAWPSSSTTAASRCRPDAVAQAVRFRLDDAARPSSAALRARLARVRLIAPPTDRPGGDGGRGARRGARRRPGGARRPSCALSRCRRSWLATLGTVAGRPDELVLAAVVDAELLAVHAAVHDALAGRVRAPVAAYLPGAWLPHCVLATDRPADAFAALHPVPPVRARVVAIEVDRTPPP